MSASTCTSLSAAGSKCAVSGGYRLSPTSGTQGGSFIDCYTDCAAAAACEGFSYGESVGSTSFCVTCNSNDASALDVDARVTHYAMCDPPGSPPAPPSPFPNVHLSRNVWPEEAEEARVAAGLPERVAGPGVEGRLRGGAQ